MERISSKKDTAIHNWAWSSIHSRSDPGSQVGKSESIKTYIYMGHNLCLAGSNRREMNLYKLSYCWEDVGLFYWKARGLELSGTVEVIGPCHRLWCTTFGNGILVFLFFTNSSCSHKITLWVKNKIKKAIHICTVQLHALKSTPTASST